MTETTIETVATEAAEWFETAHRTEPGKDDERYTRTKEGTPEWIVDMVREAHGDMLPDDWRYDCIRAAVDWIVESGPDMGPDDLDSGAFAGSQVDVYTSARIAWLGSHLSRVGYVDEGVDELRGEGQGTVDRLGIGQYTEASEVFGYVLAALEARLEEIEAKAEEAPA